MDHQLLTQSPVPVWFTDWVATPEPQEAPPEAIAHWVGLFEQHGAVLFRGTNLSRLPQILSTGVDVEPSTHHIYAAEFDKAWEYGKHPKVIAAYRTDRLDRTYRALPLDPALDEAEVRRAFPYQHTYDYFGVSFLSRLQHTTPGGPGYEWAYGYWIPGDPHEALVGLFVYGTPADREDVLRLLQTRTEAQGLPAAR